MRLRKKVTITTLAIALLPFIAAMTIALLHNSRQIKKLTLQTVQGKLDTGAEALSGYFSSRIAEIATYSNMSLLKTMDWKQIGPYMNSELSRHDGIYEKLLLGRLDSHYYVTARGNPAKGGLASFDDKDPNAKLKSIRNRPYWQITTGQTSIGQQAVYVSDPMISYTTGVKQVMVAAGIIDESGKTLGMISGAIEWTQIESQINAVRERILKGMEHGCKLFLVSADGVYIYHWDPEKVIHMEFDNAGKPLINEFGEKIVSKTKVTEEPVEQLAHAGNLMVDHQSGTAFFIDPDSKEEMTVTFSPVDSARYSIALVLPKDSIMAPVTQLRWILSTIMIITVVILLGVSIFIGRKIAIPISALSNAAKAIAAGDQHNPITSKATDEVGELTTTFNTMLHTLHQREDALKKSEERFRAVAENASSAIISADINGNIVFWNKTAENMFGYQSQEILGKPLTEIMPQRYHHAHLKGVERVATKGKTRITGQVIELYGLKKDGEEFPLDLSLSMWNIENEIFFTALINDVTLRKNAEEQIAKLAKFPAENPNPVLRISADGNVIFHNKASQLFLDYCRPEGEELVCVTCRKHITQALDSGKPVQDEINCSHTTYSLTYSPVVESGYVNLYALDITDRKMSEELLKKSEQRFRSLVENVPGAVYRSEIKPPWFFKHISEAILPVTGYTATEFMERKVYINDLIVPEEVEQIDRAVSDGVNNHVPFHLDYEIRHKDGSIHHVFERGQATYDINGNPLWLDGVILDTTDKWLIEKERLQLLRALETRNRELQDIVYVASHDLKSPLVNISGFGEELANHCHHLEDLLTKEKVSTPQEHEIERVINEDIPESLEFITAGTNKINMLINGLLQVSRVGTVKFKIEKLNMNDIIKQIVESIGFQTREKDVEITIDDLPPCMGDFPKTNQVFSNLIVNAIKYLDPEKKGKIHISGRQENNYSVYSVEDNGIGIAPEHQARVFEVFHRLNPRDSIGGEGLGLTIVMRILDRQNGRIWLESEPDKGSKFFVSLPTA